MPERKWRPKCAATKSALQLRFEVMEPRIVLSGTRISEGDLSALVTGLDNELVRWVETVEQVSDLTTPIVIAGTSFADALDFSEIVEVGFAAPLSDFLTTWPDVAEEDRTDDRVLDELGRGALVSETGFSLDIDSASGGYDGDELSFHVSLRAARERPVTIDLGSGVSGAGLNVGASINGTARYALDFEFTFGVARGSFFISVDDLTSRAQVHETVQLTALTARPAQLDTPIRFQLVINGQDPFEVIAPASSPSDLLPNLQTAIDSALGESWPEGVVVSEQDGVLILNATTGSVHSLEIRGAEALGFDAVSSAKGRIQDEPECIQNCNHLLDLGWIGLSTEAGAISIDAAVGLSVDHGGDNRLDTSELNVAPNQIETQVSSDTRGIAAGSFLVQPRVAGLLWDGQPSVEFQTNDPFSPETIKASLTNLDEAVALNHQVSAAIGKGFSKWAAETANWNELQEYGRTLPGLETSIGRQLDFGDVFRRTLGDRVARYLDGTDSPSIDGFITELEQPIAAGELTVLSPVVAVTMDDERLAFDISFVAARASSVAVAFGDEVEKTGLRFQETPTVDVRTDLTFDGSFGVELDRLPSASDAFFVEVREASTVTSVDSNVSAAVRVGFLGADVDGEIRLNTNIAAELNSGLRTPLSAIESETIDQLTTLSATVATQSVAFGVSAGVSDSTRLTGRVELADGAGLFDQGTQLQPRAFTGLQDFGELTAGAFRGAIEQIEQWLRDFANAPQADLKMPLVASKLSDVFDFAEAFARNITVPTAAVIDADGGDASLQEIVSAIGASVSGVRYEPGSHELELDLDFSSAVPRTTARVDVDFPLGSLAGIETESEINIDANVDGQMTLGFVLTPLGEGRPALTAATPLSSLNGGMGVQIDNDGLDDLRIHLRDGTLFPVNLDSVTGGSTSVAELLAALNAAGPSGFSASLNRDATGFRLTDTTAGESEFAVSAVNGSLAGLTLGVLGADEDGDGVIEGLALHGDTFADHVFIEAPRIVGAMTLEGEFDARARFGIVDVDIAAARFDPTARTITAEVRLEDPRGGAAQRITLSDLFSGLTDRSFDPPFSASSRLAGRIGIDLPTSIRGSLAGVSANQGTLGFAIPNVADLSDINFDPSAMIANAALLDLEQISLEHILGSRESRSGGLAGLLDVIGDRASGTGIVSLPSFDLDLPIVNVNLSEVVDFGAAFDRFLTEVQSKVDSVTSLQQLGELINESLDLPPETVRFSLDRSTATPALRLDLQYSHGVQQSTPLSLDVTQLGIDLPGNLADVGINVGGSSELDLSAGVTADIALGLDLSGDEVRPFLYDFNPTDRTGTSFAVHAGAAVQDINFDASLGPIGVFVRNGAGGIARQAPTNSGDPIEDAEFRFNLNGGGRHFFTEDIVGDMTTTVEAEAFVDLPINGPSEAATLSRLNLVANDLLNPSSQTSTSYPTVSKAQLEADIQQAIDALGDIDSSSLLAMVGGWRGLSDLILDAMRGEVFGLSLPLIGDALVEEADFLEEIRDSVFANLQTAAEDGVSAVKQALFDALGPEGGIDFLTDGTGDGLVTLDDIQTTIDGSEGVQFDFALGRDLPTIIVPNGFDLGLPGLGLDVDGEVHIDMGFNWDIGFGLSLSEGVYLDTHDDGAPDMVVSLEVTTPGLSAVGNLGFLQLDVEDLVRVTNDPGDATQFKATFSVDLVDPALDMADGKLTLSEATGAELSEVLVPNFDAVADVNLQVTTSVGGSDLFPQLRADFHLDWSFHDPDSSPSLVGFENVQMNLGSFFDGLVGDTLGKVQEVLAPVQPVIDVLTARLPVISDLSGSDITLVDLGRLFGRADVADFAQSTIDVINLINSLPTDAGPIWIDLGSFNLDGALARDDSTLSNMGGRGLTPQFDAAALPNPMSQVRSSTPSGSKWADNLAGARSGTISFPLIESPLTAFKLLLGQDVDLFVYDSPTLGVDFSYSQFFPVPPFPILGAEIAGRIYATADFQIGFDTSGLREFQTTGNFADVFDGFFVADVDANGTDVAEAQLGGSLTAGAKINLLLAEAGVRGGIFANVDFNLHDYQDPLTGETDGKIRADEILRSLNLGPVHIFDVAGQVDAGLEAFLNVNLLLFQINDVYEIARAKLLDFDLERPDPMNLPTLATRNGGVLTLNLTDESDKFVILPGSNPNSVIIESNGYRTDQFSGINLILGDAGLGNDEVTIKSGVTIPTELSGGEGNDVLIGGGGAVVFHGGRGDDQLTGSTAADQLFGDEGHDSVSGGEGDDDLEGGSGNDHLEGGRGDDVLRGQIGADELLGGRGGDQLVGGEGNDVLIGGRGDDDLRGGADDDQLNGGQGDDLLVGGTDDDVLRGDTGQDTIYGDNQDGTGAGVDYVDGGLLNDTIFGGGGEDTLLGSAGNDTIHGEGGADEIRGGGGSDDLLGGDSDDTIFADDQETPSATANHTIDGGAGDDHIFGGSGANTVFARSGNDTITTFGGNDTIDAGPDDDTVTAGDGNNFIVGGAGNDVLTGGDGLDVIWGGLAELPAEEFFDPTFASFQLPRDFQSSEDFRNSGYVPLRLVTPSGTRGISITSLIPDGDDTLSGRDGTDWLFGGNGGDSLFGGRGADYVDAGNGRDTDVFGGAGDDVIVGGSGDDVIQGGAGIDQLYGDDGRDYIYGDAGDSNGSTAGQRLYGGAGDDFLYAWSEDTNVTNRRGDELRGGLGGDFLYGSLREDILIGGPGPDFLSGDALAGPTYSQNTAAATVGSKDLLLGGGGEDQLYGGGGADELWGGANSDWLEGQDDLDQVRGGGGIDILVLDVDASYSQLGGDQLDGHADNEPTPETGLAPPSIPDDNATDVLQIQGTEDPDRIRIGETALGELLVSIVTLGAGGLETNRIGTAKWRAGDAENTPLVEQFRIAGFGGNDIVEFITGNNALDFSDLIQRSNDFVTQIDGGPGDDRLSGTSGRDRIDGGFGSDTIFGFAGDDRLWGDQGIGRGSRRDTDSLFAGQGNDDLIGGQGDNLLYAWSSDPTAGQFGIFTDQTGTRFNDDGGGTRQLEDTGLNRMLGQGGDDLLYGGTGLDFLYGGTGTNTLFGKDGRPFEDADGGITQDGDGWKSYARSLDKVWYVSASNVDDVISVDFVTEPGVLQGHHLVTRLTNNDGNFTFDAQVRLDFAATDDDGNLIWDPTKLLVDFDSLADNNPFARAAALNQRFRDGDPELLGSLLPPEGDFLAIVVDALDGDDQVAVGPTVQKTVWVDGGDGDDHIEVTPGLPILSDQAEGPGRNDRPLRATTLPGSATAEASRDILPDNGQLSRDATFAVVIDNEISSVVTIPAATTRPDGSGAAGNQSREDLVADINQALVAAGLENRIRASLSGARLVISTTSGDTDAQLAISTSNGNPANTEMGLATFSESFGSSRIVSTTTFGGLTIDHPTDQDFYRFVLDSPPAKEATISFGTRSSDGRLFIEIFAADGSKLPTAPPLVDGALNISSLSAGTTYLLRVASDAIPSAYDLHFNLVDGNNPVVVDLTTTPAFDRRDVLIGGRGDDVVSGGLGEDWAFGGSGNDVLTGGLDRGTSDLLFGADGDDTLQIIPDRLPVLSGSETTFLPTFSDRFDGGDGEDRALYLGGDLDANERPVNDFVALRFNRFLQRYEVAARIWDVSNQRFVGDERNPASEDLVYHFFTSANLESLEVDTQSGDDEVHADGGFTFTRNGDEWGFSTGDFQTGGSLTEIMIQGGDGKDRLFGGPYADALHGGDGEDVILGGPGDDRIAGGPGQDLLVGNRTSTPDRFEFVTRAGRAAANDDFRFASLLDNVAPGAVISDVSFHHGDTGDWYLIPSTPAKFTWGTADVALLDPDLITVSRTDTFGSAEGDGEALPFSLFAARSVSGDGPNDVLPVEEFSGIPPYYLLHIARSEGLPALEYEIQFDERLGETVHVDGRETIVGSISSGQLGGQPVLIPIGDFNNDGFDDHIYSVNDSISSIVPTSANMVFGDGDAFDPSNISARLLLPAPVVGTARTGLRSVFSNPGDYNGDGHDDIAVAVTRTDGSLDALPVEGVYLLFGRSDAVGAVWDLVRDADAAVGGFNGTLSIASAGHLNSDVYEEVVADGDQTFVFHGREDWNTNIKLFEEDFDDPDFRFERDFLGWNQNFPDIFDSQQDTVRQHTGLWNRFDTQAGVPGHSAPSHLHFGNGVNFNVSDVSGTVHSAVIPIDRQTIDSATLSFNYLLQTQDIEGKDAARVYLDMTAGTGVFTRFGLIASNQVADLASSPFAIPIQETSNGWQEFRYDLTQLIPDFTQGLFGMDQVDLQVTWEFDAVDAVNNDLAGWHIDDVLITSPARADTFADQSYGTVGTDAAGLSNFDGSGSVILASMNNRPHLDPQTVELFSRAPEVGSVGNPVEPRPLADAAVGSIFILDEPFADPGSRVTDWSVYSSAIGQQITPLIMKRAGGGWQVMGIGSTRTIRFGISAEFDFDLLAGSDLVEEDTYFAWKDGTVGTDNVGVPRYTDGGSQSVFRLPSQNRLAVNDILPRGDRMARTYSVAAQTRSARGDLSLTRADGLSGYQLASVDDLDGNGTSELLVTGRNDSYLILGHPFEDYLSNDLDGLVANRQAVHFAVGNLRAVGDMDGDQIPDFAAIDLADSPTLDELGSISHQRIQLFLGVHSYSDAAVLHEFSTPDVVFEPASSTFTDSNLAEARRFGLAANPKAPHELLIATGSLMERLVGQTLMPASGNSAEENAVAAQPPEFFEFGLALPLGESSTDIDVTNSLSNTDLANAIAITGVVANEQLSEVTEIGDINGDGYLDALLSGHQTSYVAYGPLRLDGVVSATDLADMVIDEHALGRTMATAGDINDDGRDELLFVRAQDTYSVVSVVFGAEGLPRRLDDSLVGVDELLGRTGLSFLADANARAGFLNWNGDAFDDLYVVSPLGGFVYDGEALSLGRTVQLSGFHGDDTNRIELVREQLGLTAATQVDSFRQFATDEFEPIDPAFFFDAIAYDPSTDQLFVHQSDIDGLIVSTTSGVEVRTSGRVLPHFFESRGGLSIAQGPMRFAGQDFPAFSLLLFDGDGGPRNNIYVLGKGEDDASQTGVTLAQIHVDVPPEIYDTGDRFQGLIRGGAYDPTRQTLFVLVNSSGGPNSVILEVDPNDGDIIRHFETIIRQPARGTVPANLDLAIDRITGHLLTSSVVDGTLHFFEYTPDGELVQTIAQEGFGLPKAFTIDSNRGEVYITSGDSSDPKILRFSGFRKGGALRAESAGDFNGDGLDDLILGDPRFVNFIDSSGLSNVGRSYLLTGTTEVGELQLNTDSLVTIQGFGVGDNISALGDLNQDGYDDFAVTRGIEDDLVAPGAAFVFYGSSSESFPAGKVSQPELDADIVLRREGADRLLSGQVVAGPVHVTAGDLDGNGQQDLLVGLPQTFLVNATGSVLSRDTQGQAFVVSDVSLRSGSLVLRPDEVAADEGATDAPVTRLTGQFVTDRFGVLSPRPATDLNDDGVADAVIGAPGSNNALQVAAGRVYVLPGEQQFRPLGEGPTLENSASGKLIARTDGQPHTVSGTLSNAQPQQWYRFRTAGDGQVGNQIRIVSFNDFRRPVADLLDARGRVLVSGQPILDLRNATSGEYAVRIYMPSTLLRGETVSFGLEISAPTFGFSHPTTDFDVIYGGDGRDGIIGEGDDALFGEGGDDSFIAADYEVRDAAPSESRSELPAHTTRPRKFVNDPGVVFPDPAIHAGVAAALGVPVTMGFDGRPHVATEIRSSDLTGITDLDLSGQGIDSLAGIEQLPNLTALQLNDNLLSDASSLVRVRMVDDADEGFQASLGWQTSLSATEGVLDGHYRFLGDAEITMYRDGSGNANHARLGNGDASVAPLIVASGNPNGAFGSALSFTSADEFVEVPRDSSLVSDHVSVSVWLKLDALGGKRNILTKQTDTGLSYGLELLADNRFNFFAFDESGAVRDVQSANIATADAWIHLVGSYDAATSTPRLYVNGAEDSASRSGSGGGAIGHGGQASLFIGARTNLPAILGQIDEVAIFDRVLRDVDVVHLSRGPMTGSEPGLRGMWDFDDQQAARWEASGLAQATYEVQVAYLAGTNRTTAANYQLFDGRASIASVALDQQQAPDASDFGGASWASLGTHEIRSGEFVVELTDGEAGIVVADAMRLIRVDAPVTHLEELDLRGNPLSQISQEEVIPQIESTGTRVIADPSPAPIAVAPIPNRAAGVTVSNEFGGHLQFNDEAAVLPNDVLNGMNSVLTEFRFRTTTPRAHTIVSSANNSQHNEYSIFVLNANTIRVIDKGFVLDFSGLPNLADGRWHHIAVARDFIRNWNWLFVDGESYGNQLVGVSTTSLSVSVGGLVLGQDQDEVGGNYQPTDAAVGDLDELRVWQGFWPLVGEAQEQASILSHIQQFADAELTGSEPNLFAYFKFNEMDGTQLLDSAGTRHGVLGDASGSEPRDRRGPAQRTLASETSNVIDLRLTEGDVNQVFFTATTDSPKVDAVVEGHQLTLTPEDAYQGTVTVTVTAHGGTVDKPTGARDARSFDLSVGRQAIYGRLFDDLNGDGVRVDEVGLDGVQIHLFNASDARIATTYTDAKGSYRFVNLPLDQSYRVQPILPDGRQPTSTAGTIDRSNSLQHPFRYEFDVDPTDASLIDLDGNGFPDISSVGGPTVRDGLARILSNRRYGINEDTTTVWPTLNVSVEDGFTIDFGIKVIDDPARPEGDRGSFSLAASPNGTRVNTLLNIGLNGQGWGSSGDSLGTNDNSDQFHHFRVRQSPGSAEFYVWRDGLLLNPGGQPLGSGIDFEVAPRLIFGDGGTPYRGHIELDYFRFTPGMGSQITDGVDIGLTPILHVTDSAPGNFFIGETVNAVAIEGTVYDWSMQRNGLPYPSGNQQPNGRQFQFTPTEEGTYVVQVTVDGSLTGSQQLLVVDGPPVVELPQSLTASEGETVVVTPVVFDAGAAAGLSHRWQVTGPNGNVEFASQLPVLNYPPADDGVFTIRLAVTDSGNNTTVAETSVTVSNISPEVAFEGDLLIALGEPFVLRGSLSHSGVDVLTGTAEFGDGTTSPLILNTGAGTVTAEHRYQKTGEYVVRVTVDDQDGVPQIAEVNVEVTEPDPRIPGDANLDGEVGFDDFVLLSDNFGKQVDAVWEDGDFDGDGRVDFDDFVILSENFGTKRQI